MASPQFQQAVVHITQNSSDGKTSSFVNQTHPPPTQPIPPTSQLSYIYSTLPSFSLSSNADLTHHTAILSSSSTPGTPSIPPTFFLAAGGSACVIIDFAPNLDDSPGSMHKTRTLDYLVILEGELELELFGGEGKVREKRIVKRGEVVVRGSVGIVGEMRVGRRGRGCCVLRWVGRGLLRGRWSGLVRLVSDKGAESAKGMVKRV
ncbi:hypothetical protein BDZ45DRAFT_727623 [Acephala macrosclerotiorum]|nr:hypothetical protein BDZ45DRAFT_727623 [Acephala macrosclerotiorum]